MAVHPPAPPGLTDGRDYDGRVPVIRSLVRLIWLPVIVVFVIGEMLWVPTSQSIVARLAPEDVRGAYMGAFGAAPAIGFALSPLLGLSIRNEYGDDSMWFFFAAIGVVGVVLGAVGSTRAGRAGPPRLATGEA